MAKGRKDSFSPDVFAEDIQRLGELNDVQRILIGTEGEEGREAGILALTGLIAEGIDALAEAVHEARG